MDMDASYSSIIRRMLWQSKHPYLSIDHSDARFLVSSIMLNHHQQCYQLPPSQSSLQCSIREYRLLKTKGWMTWRADMLMGTSCYCNDSAVCIGNPRRQACHIISYE
eukprot:scaffold174691_cov39-Prasinocladus_malaysianus.AAC.1